MSGAGRDENYRVGEPCQKKNNTRKWYCPLPIPANQPNKKESGNTAQVTKGFMGITESSQRVW